MHTLVVFASGRGSNARAIAEYVAQTGLARIGLVVANKAGLGVLDWAESAGIPTVVANDATLASDAFLQQIQNLEPSMLVLAGFLRKIPESLITAFPDQIINIHPALLPKYGGKGMWGHYVHQAVLAAGDTEAGITIHRVNAHYDEGTMLLQACCPVLPDDDVDTLAARVLRLEHYYYPRTIEFLLTTLDQTI
ncbi:MAG: phosphoribosylglycinamide formyltransferase [Sphingobacteriales bacterium]|nr:MAG: phosphoribosylglycinamide formyltransferase [Sphingobacteriales bacterium]